jgi:DNA-directed RNA polymerase specialized sigma24 family protein
MSAHFTLEIHTSEDFFVSSPPPEDPAVFSARFSRCRRLLYFIACRVLDGSEGAADAVNNCFHAASRHPLGFEYEASFRSWLLRILIGEALLIRRRNNYVQVPGNLSR